MIYSISHARKVESFLVLGNREQGTGNRDWKGLGRIGKDWEGLVNTQKIIKSSPLPLQGQDKVDKVDKVTREKNSTKSVGDRTPQATGRGSFHVSV
ncbi:hypothetical protein NWP22_08720 [Anabaenopsis tanganyikae CS-531]|uniref:Transposase n=1 Tax=Anabaenopsis tanganyikae CS-531 TaxID=2785304 RepID=A0ABT6KDM5_9CYAN|nr:hypothetical protein [Anabaenopsis tanganyikae]MDH6105947.1 hypothetical protein [Anabaenopsis tanganyikae CS-531]